MSRSFQTVKPRFWVILFLILAMVMAGMYAVQQSYINRQNEAIAELEHSLEELLAAKQELQEQIDFTQTDEYIEREARKRGLVKEGETLYQSNDIPGGE